MTILHNILGDLLYSFLGSPFLVFLEHMLVVAALHVDARGQGVAGQAAALRLQRVHGPRHPGGYIKLTGQDWVRRGQNQC